MFDIIGGTICGSRYGTKDMVACSVPYVVQMFYEVWYAILGIMDDNGYSVPNMVQKQNILGIIVCNTSGTISGIVNGTIFSINSIS